MTQVRVSVDVGAARAGRPARRSRERSLTQVDVR